MTYDKRYVLVRALFSEAVQQVFKFRTADFATTVLVEEFKGFLVVSQVVNLGLLT